MNNLSKVAICTSLFIIAIFAITIELHFILCTLLNIAFFFSALYFFKKHYLTITCPSLMGVSMYLNCLLIETPLMGVLLLGSISILLITFACLNIYRLVVGRNRKTEEQVYRDKVGKMLTT